MSRSGPAPFGYTRLNGKLVPHQQEAPIRILMFDLFLEHRRKKTVADILNQMGHRTRHGAFFTGPTVTRLLNDEAIVGVPGQVHALIGKDLFEKCQNILRAQKKGGGTSRKPKHIFTGLTYCLCGGKMYVQSGSKKYTCRACKAKILAADLEAVVLEHIRGHDDQTTLTKHLREVTSKWHDLDLTERHSFLVATTTRIEINSKGNRITVTLAAL